MADLSHLGNLREAEPLNLDETYPANRKSSFQLPEHGVYTLQAPQFEQASFGATNAGDLKVTIDPTIVGPKHAGFVVRRTTVSNKVFQRKGRNVSYLGDYLISAGYQGPASTTDQQADAVIQTSGATFQAELDWRAENWQTKFKVEGMKNFPKNPDGTYQSWVIDESSKNDDGTPKRLLANLYVRNYLAPSQS